MSQSNNSDLTHNELLKNNDTFFSNEDILDSLSNLQDQYAKNIRQHLYSTYILRKVLKQNNNTMVHLPKRVSFWPRKVTADTLKERLAYDYTNETDDFSVVSNSNETIDSNSNDNIYSLMNSEIMARFQSKLFEKLREKDENFTEEDFLKFLDSKILPKQNMISESILTKFEAILRSMNYEFVANKRKAITYKNVLRNSRPIYEEDVYTDKYEAFVLKCEKLFSKKIIDDNYVSNRFKIHGDIIISDDEEEEEEEEEGEVDITN
ncbi:hypothetical protein ACO0SA_003390 [Hanseniaspora valbyensis]